MNGHFKTGFPKNMWFPWHKSIPTLFLNPETHIKKHGVDQLRYMLSGALRSPTSGPIHSVENTQRLRSACTVIFIQSFAILLSLHDVELLLCVDAPRVVVPRKAFARPRYPHPLFPLPTPPPTTIYSQIIFITRLFKVIRGKAWDTHRTNTGPSQ